MSYIRLTPPIVTSFAYHNFRLHTIRVSPNAFLFVPWHISYTACLLSAPGLWRLALHLTGLFISAIIEASIF